MKHFPPLERCGRGAYRYLAAREHGRSFEIVLIHHTHEGVRKYVKIADIQKFGLDYHRARNNALGHGDSLVEKLAQIRGDLDRVIATARIRNKMGLDGTKERGTDEAHM